jgi:iduronate 2-sulfatase
VRVGKRSINSVTESVPRPAYFDRTDKGVPDVMGYSVRIANRRYTEWRDWTTGKVVAAEHYPVENLLKDPRNRIDDPKAAAGLDVAREVLHRKFPPDVAPAKR